MKVLLSIFGALLFGAGIAYIVAQDSGYVLIGYKNYTIETSVVFFVVGLIALFISLFFLFRFLGGVKRTPGRMKNWRDKKRFTKQQKALTRGMMELAEGQWRAAEKTLIAHAPKGNAGSINYLLAAQAAQQLSAPDRRDEYIRRAHTATPTAQIAVALTQADLQIHQGQHEQALATLDHLHQVAPRHARVLMLQRNLYESIGDWERLHDLLPELMKKNILDDAEQKSLQEKVCRGLIEQTARSGQLQDLQEVWDRSPKWLRKQTPFVLQYCGFLINLGAGEQAEILLRQELKREWDPVLVHAYGLIENADYEQQLGIAEGWLSGHEQDAVLLLTLGRLCIRRELWGKARSYLESSLAVEPRFETYKALGALLDQLGEKDQALSCLQKGLLLSPDDTPFPQQQRSPVVVGKLATINHAVPDAVQQSQSANASVDSSAGAKA